MINSDDVYKSWIKSELYGGLNVKNGGMMCYNLQELFNLANNGDLPLNGWKRLILLIKSIRGLYLIPDIVTDVVKVDWLEQDITLEDLAICKNWEYKCIIDTLDYYANEDNVHNTNVENTANKYRYKWKDEPLIFVTSSDLNNYDSYRLIDGNHRARRYLRANYRNSVKCYVGLIKMN